MKAIIFATLLVCLFAFNVEEIISKQDECTAKVFEIIKPQVDAKLEELKKVTYFLFRTTALTSKSNSSPSSRRERRCLTSATKTRPPSRSETSSNGTEWPSSSPPTASRMSELNSSSSTPLSSTPRTSPTMLPLPSSDTSSADKASTIASSSSTSSSDLFVLHPI